MASVPFSQPVSIAIAILSHHCSCTAGESRHPVECIQVIILEDGVCVRTGVRAF